jgi:UDP-GlcNAc:undecaprenyl-phosphate GlcNAc-1-phosphate transferase
MEFNIYIQALLFFFFAFIVSFFVIPVIINVVKLKRLYEKRNERSSHHLPTPSFGGIALFVVLVLALSMAEHLFSDQLSNYLIISLTILFFIGLKDDLTGISPGSKLATQILATTFLFLSPHFQITNFHGWLGIESMHPYLFFPLAILVVAFFVNAYNLIDGIDGLAAMLGIVFSSGFALFFAELKEWTFFYSCIALNGGLIAFLRYNLSSNRKIFLGDTGSLVLGFFFVSCALALLSREEEIIFQIRGQNFPYVLIALVFVPVVDSLRVFFVRIKEGRSPFSADRNHIHHVLTDYFDWPHIRTSIALAFFNIAVFSLFLVISIFLSQIFVAVFLVILLVALTAFLTYLRKKRDISTEAL